MLIDGSAAQQVTLIVFSYFVFTVRNEVAAR